MGDGQGSGQLPKPAMAVRRRLSRRRPEPPLDIEDQTLHLLREERGRVLQPAHRRIYIAANPIADCGSMTETIYRDDRLAVLAGPRSGGRMNVAVEFTLDAVEPDVETALYRSFGRGAVRRDEGGGYDIGEDAHLRAQEPDPDSPQAGPKYLLEADTNPGEGEDLRSVGRRLLGLCRRLMEEADPGTAALHIAEVLPYVDAAMDLALPEAYVRQPLEPDPAIAE